MELQAAEARTLTARRRRGGNDVVRQEDALFASRGLMTVVVITPVAVLAISAIILWRPFLRAWIRFCKARLAAALVEVAVSGPFVGFCVGRVARTEAGPSLLASACLKGAWLAAVWGSCVAIASLPVAWALGLPQRWRPLVLYAPLVVFYAPRRPPTEESRSASQLAEPALVEPLLGDSVGSSARTAAPFENVRRGFEVGAWYAPQLLAAVTLQRLFGVRMHEPQATIVDARLAVGAAPLHENDILELASKFRVGSILEIHPPGAACLAAYAKVVGPDSHAVIQAHERDGVHSDDLRAATSFVRRRVDAEPHKRVFVACPDGVRLAPLVAAAYICVTQRCDVAHAADTLERRMPNISAAALRADASLARLADLVRDERELDDWFVISTGEVGDI
ncbi:hypothetical protein CTAYLR_009023 [Chrysophaeum taylorii]|uniref:Tyrosine specific protein phosphatases domain-containing protein n=1 Tax=Chrysophaeum taylorii TaxID=2483200 RepID=A0AAD7XM11_9STRA|nr:hypothetical protein CTAYLR_009023 [Chrysophaeum taylorii]